MSRRRVLKKLQKLPPPYQRVTDPLPAYGKASAPTTALSGVGGGPLLGLALLAGSFFAGHTLATRSSRR